MSQQVVTQEQLNSITAQILIGGCARLILTIATISAMCTPMVTGSTTILIILMVFRQLSESDKTNHKRYLKLNKYLFYYVYNNYQL